MNEIKENNRKKNNVILYPIASLGLSSICKCNQKKGTAASPVSCFNPLESL